MSNCFLCLNKSSNKICPQCFCVAHPKCWGKYINNSSVIQLELIFDVILMYSPYTTICPVCRYNIPTVKPITRSQTSKIKFTTFFNNYQKIIDFIDKLEVNKSEFYRLLFNLVIEFKKDVNNDELFLNMIKNKLIELHKKQEWGSANIYYNLLFGEQIK